MRRLVSASVIIVLLIVLVACSPAKPPYEVVGKQKSDIPEDMVASIEVLLGHWGHMLNLRGCFVFEPGKYDISDTYLWINTDGRTIELMPITEKNGVINVVINEIDRENSELGRYLLIKFPGKKSQFKVTTTHKNFSTNPELDRLVIEESRSGLAGTFIGGVDAHSVEIKIDADVAWPDNDVPTVFRMVDEVFTTVGTLNRYDRVLLDFYRNKNGELFITAIEKTQ